MINNQVGGHGCGS